MNKEENEMDLATSSITSKEKAKRRIERANLWPSNILVSGIHRFSVKYRTTDIVHLTRLQERLIFIKTMQENV
jgi:hypothetical protein